MSVIFVDDELAIIYVNDGDGQGEPPTAAQGIRIGDEPEAVQEAFGDRVDEFEDEYGTRHYDVYDDATDRGMSFRSEDGEAITSIQAGTSVGLGLIEGCI